MILPLMLVIAACQPQAAPLSDDDVASIERALQSFQDAALAGDFTTAVESYTEDAVFMPPNAPIYVGREAELDHLESGAPAVSFAWSAVEVHGVGDLAYARGPYAVSFLMGADTVSIQGKWVGIFRKQPDGAWRMSLEIWNLNDPLPPTADEHSEGEDHT